MMKQQYRFLKKHIKKVIKKASKAAVDSGSEICGLLVDNGYFIELINLSNKKAERGGFEFYAHEVRFIEEATMKMNHEIIGTFHSHPAYIAKPSNSDIEYAVNDSIMMVIDVLDKKMGLWHIKDQKGKKIKYELI